MGPEPIVNSPVVPPVQIDTGPYAMPPGMVRSFDPINLFTPVQEFFLPLGKDQTNTSLGIWFDAVGLLHIYLQQAIVPDNIFTQVKLITLRLPIPLGFMISNIIQSMFFSRAFLLGIRAATAQTTIQVQRLVDRILENIRNKALRPES